MVYFSLKIVNNPSSDSLPDSLFRPVRHLFILFSIMIQIMICSLVNLSGAEELYTLQIQVD